MSVDRNQLVGELVEYFRCQGFSVHGAKGIEGYKPPPAMPNDGFGDRRTRIPDVIGMDPLKSRIVFGIIRETREELDSEQSLTDYNVFLDHRYAAGEQASGLIVLLPPSLTTEFTNIITHYVHREYWHRVLGVSSRLLE